MKIGISEIYSYLRMTGMAVLAAGLIGCGGGGGGDSDGGPNIPTASNAAITPPPTDPLIITTGAETTIATTAFQAWDGAQTAGSSSGVFSVGATSTVSETTRLTIAEIVRRQVEKIKDHKGSASVTGAQMVNTFPCTGGGTETFVFDDANGNFSDILVHCNEAGTILHGTISVTGISGNFIDLGGTYEAFGAATLTIDLSITSATNALDVVVFQGAINFRIDEHGPMIGGTPGAPTYTKMHMDGLSLLTSDGTYREKLSNFSFTVEDDALGTTVNNTFTYANTVIGGSITFTTVTAFHTNPGKLHPHVGVARITGAGTKILHISVQGDETFTPAGNQVRIDVDTNGDGAIDATTFYSWAQLGL